MTRRRRHDPLYRTRTEGLKDIAVGATVAVLVLSGLAFFLATFF